MYNPKFIITNQILKNIGIIEAAREIIENSPLIPAYEKKFQDEAMLRTVHHGTHIEGNDLTFLQAQRVLEGEQIIARERDIQEVINYRNVMHYLDNIPKPIHLNMQVLLMLHKLTIERIIANEQVGKVRQTQVVIKDGSSGEVIFRPPPAIEVMFLLEDFFAWLNSAGGRELHSVLRAGIAHYVLVAIHPFVEGNGRVARAFATLVLFAEGYDIKKLFSLEEYFDRDAASYYEAIKAVDEQASDLAGRDMTPWLEYFTRGLSFELSRIKDQIKRLSVDLKLKDKFGGQIELSERQLKFMEYLSKRPTLRRLDAKKLLPMISEDTILRELQDLIKKGIINKVGAGRGAKYKLKA